MRRSVSACGSGRLTTHVSKPSGTFESCIAKRPVQPVFGSDQVRILKMRFLFFNAFLRLMQAHATCACVHNHNKIFSII